MTPQMGNFDSKIIAVVSKLDDLDPQEEFIPRSHPPSV